MPDPRVDVTGLPPAEQHTATLAALDDRTALPGAGGWQGGRDLEGLAGRRHILERHAPEQRRVWRDPAPTDPNDILIIDARNVLPGTDNSTAHVCPRCARGASHLGPALWPCPDYRDAANGLVTGWETPNAQ